MRVDSINLLGTFSINGLTGSQDQILGFSGSQTYWITPVASGGFGETGPQGPTGAGNSSIPNNRIAFGCVTSVGMTSSEFFTFDTGANIFILGSNHQGSGGQSTILGGFTSSIINSGYGTIIGGDSHKIDCSSNSSILGGKSNEISTYFLTNCYNSILGGANNLICNGKNSSILGGYSNKFITITPGYHNRSVILSGSNNCTHGVDYQTSVIAGNKNCTWNMNESAIIGGNYNILGINGGNPYLNSVIVGGCSWNLWGNNSVIVGGCPGSDPNAQDGQLGTPNTVMIGGGARSSDLNIYCCTYHCSAFAEFAYVSNNLRLCSYNNCAYGGRDFKSGHPSGIFFLQPDKGSSNYLTFYNNSTQYCIKLC